MTDTLQRDMADALERAADIRRRFSDNGIVNGADIDFLLHEVERGSADYDVSPRTAHTAYLRGWAAGRDAVLRMIGVDAAQPNETLDDCWRRIVERERTRWTERELALHDMSELARAVFLCAPMTLVKRLRKAARDGAGRPARLAWRDANGLSYLRDLAEYCERWERVR